MSSIFLIGEAIEDSETLPEFVKKSFSIISNTCNVEFIQSDVSIEFPVRYVEIKGIFPIERFSPSIRNVSKLNREFLISSR